MTLTRQLLAAIGRSDGGARQSARSLSSRIPTGVSSPPYFWVGLAAAGAAAMWLGKRAATGRRRVKDVMIPSVVTIDGSATLMDAARKMKDANVGVLPVVTGDTLRGIVTDRDLVVRGMARGADPSTTLVSECATHDLVCARPDSSIEEAMEVMAECQVGRLPVVDERNRVVGIVTLSSLALRSRDDDEALDTAKEVSRRSTRSA